jgi:hypothetical protein
MNGVAISAEKHRLSDSDIPYFCWDRPWSVGEIKKKLASQEWPEKSDLVAWIMREAAFADVWLFLTPQEVDSHLKVLAPLLGRRRELWEYIVKAWHELGKLKSDHAA